MGFRGPRDHHDLEITLSPFGLRTALGDSAEPPSVDVAPKVSFEQMDEWWTTEFTEQERQYVRKRMRRKDFHPFTFGSPYRALVYPEDQLRTLATWFHEPKGCPMGIRMLEKAEELANDDVAELHRVYEAMIDTYYRGREAIPGYLEAAVQTCGKQIAQSATAATVFGQRGLFLPSHRGFERLAIILEKRRDFTGCIALCEEAREQGWCGDWDRRIARCRAKVDRLSA